jgi:ubiquitin-protein ligase E3 C
MRTLVLYMVRRAAQGTGDPSLRNLTRGGDGRTNMLLGEFARLLLEVLDNKIILDDALKLLPLLAASLPDIVDANYYRALSQVTISSGGSPEAILRAILTPLHLAGKVGEKSYAEVSRYYAANYLVTPGLPDHLGRDSFELLRSGVDAGKLVRAMAEYPETWTTVPTEERLWMLSYIIHFFLKVSGRKIFIDLTTDNMAFTNKEVDERSYIQVLLLLLSSVATEAGNRIDVEDVPMEIGNENEDDEDEYPSGGKSVGTTKQPLPPFVKSELNSLVEQSSVNSIFSHASFFAHDDDHAKVLAGFALTLLMVFPSRKEEICMWLCLAETSDGVFAVKYLWEAVKGSHLFQAIVKNFSVAVDSLRKHNSSASTPGVSAHGPDDDDEWNLILLFVELYGFLLLVMDDDEFFARGKGEGRARQLPLREVGDMTVFLKNLAFAMYWSGGYIMGEDKQRHDGGEVVFKDQGSQAWDIAHLRGAVTSLLRMIYTREYSPNPPNLW